MRARRAAAVFVFFACSLGADNYPRQSGVDVQHYIFRVGLRDDSNAITGETAIRVRFLEAGLAEWALDLASPAAGKGMTVTEVSSGGTPVPYTHRSGRLRIALRPASQAGEVRQFTVKYHGVPASGLLILKNKFGDRCFFSINWPNLTHQWLPTIDHPSDKAPSEFFVTAPAKYQVVSNGRLQEVTVLPDGRRVTHWAESVPIAAWLNNIGVAQFALRRFGTAADVPLEAWLFPKDRAAGIATLEEPTRQAIQFFRDYIGPYPYERLAGVEAAGFNGGMEVASSIFYSEDAITGVPAFSLVVHETAHQWFGDSVTEKDWDDIWLSEGFATYFAMLATEHYQGREAFVAQLRSSRVRIFAAEKESPGMAVVQDRPWDGVPDQIVYQKGAWVLHLLRGQIGTEKFRAGIREYYRSYRDSNASTADFERVMEEVSGSDLGWFFKQWLWRAGSPVVEAKWHYNSGAKRLEVDLAQTQPGEPYRLPMEIGYTGGRAVPRVARIQMTEKQQRFEIPMADRPAAVELDPHTWLLMDAHSSGN